MQTYRCTCGNRLFFENTQCLACGADVGWCEGCRRLTTLQPEGDGSSRCSYLDCRVPLKKCSNYAVENVCNCCFNSLALRERVGARENPNGCSTPLPPHPNPLPEGEGADALCGSCRLTETIPDLTVPGNREKWARLEAAKRRLLYTLDRIGLPYADATPPLSFDFKADVEPPANEWRDAGDAEMVYTGHADGKITINLREADDAEREKLRVTFHEAHRTLIGHFHHEVGHYYWQLLVQGRREKDCLKHFGDHNHPPYAEAMAAYYQNGPREDWRTSFISAYASAHPWEDFAETFALYLDVVAVLDTASHLYKSVRANIRGRSVAPMVAQFLEVGVLGNEINRTMGLIDLAPKLVVPPVVEKLEFIHKVVKSGVKKQCKQSGATPPIEHEPAPMLMQQDLRPFEMAPSAAGS